MFLRPKLIHPLIALCDLEGRLACTWRNRRWGALLVEIYRCSFHKELHLNILYSTRKALLNALRSQQCLIRSSMNKDTKMGYLSYAALNNMYCRN